MRVIAGEFRSRILHCPPGLETRPTPDRLRESLFNILAPRIAGAVFVDAYAGCGSVGIEAISRGAAKVTFIERNRQAVAAIQENLNSLRIGPDRATVIHGNVSTYIDVKADIYFLDPPYERPGEYAATLDILGGHGPALVIAQHLFKQQLADQYRSLRRYRQLKQGDNILSFYETID
jgi:16S rRNA (guanine(966)-N(2))-methyltransferase RsmD